MDMIIFLVKLAIGIVNLWDYWLVRVNPYGTPIAPWNRSNEGW